MYYFIDAICLVWIQGPITVSILQTICNAYYAFCILRILRMHHFVCKMWPILLEFIHIRNSKQVFLSYYRSFLRTPFAVNTIILFKFQKELHSGIGILHTDFIGMWSASCTLANTFYIEFHVRNSDVIFFKKIFSNANNC